MPLQEGGQAAPALVVTNDSTSYSVHIMHYRSVYQVLTYSYTTVSVLGVMPDYVVLT